MNKRKGSEDKNGRQKTPSRRPSMPSVIMSKAVNSPRPKHKPTEKVPSVQNLPLMEQKVDTLKISQMKKDMELCIPKTRFSSLDGGIESRSNGSPRLKTFPAEKIKKLESPPPFSPRAVTPLISQHTGDTTGTVFLASPKVQSSKSGWGDVTGHAEFLQQQQLQNSAHNSSQQQVDPHQTAQPVNQMNHTSDSMIAQHQAVSSKKHTHRYFVPRNTNESPVNIQNSQMTSQVPEKLADSDVAIPGSHYEKPTSDYEKQPVGGRSSDTYRRMLMQNKQKQSQASVDPNFTNPPSNAVQQSPDLRNMPHLTYSQIPMSPCPSNPLQIHQQMQQNMARERQMQQTIAHQQQMQQRAINHYQLQMMNNQQHQIHAQQAAYSNSSSQMEKQVSSQGMISPQNSWTKYNPVEEHTTIKAQPKPFKADVVNTNPSQFVAQNRQNSSQYQLSRTITPHQRQMLCSPDNPMCQSQQSLKIQNTSNSAPSTLVQQSRSKSIAASPTESHIKQNNNKKRSLLFTPEMIRDQEVLVSTMRQQGVPDEIMRRQFDVMLNEQQKHLMYLEELQENQYQHQHQHQHHQYQHQYQHQHKPQHQEQRQYQPQYKHQHQYQQQHQQQQQHQHQHQHQQQQQQQHQHQLQQQQQHQQQQQGQQQQQQQHQYQDTPEVKRLETNIRRNKVLNEKPEWMAHLTPARVSYTQIEKLRPGGNQNGGRTSEVVEHDNKMQQVQQSKANGILYQTTPQSSQPQNHQSYQLGQQTNYQYYNGVPVANNVYLQPNLMFTPNRMDEPSRLERDPTMMYQQYPGSIPNYNVNQYPQQQLANWQFQSQENRENSGQTPNQSSNDSNVNKYLSCSEDKKLLEPSSLLKLREYKEVIRPQKRNNGLQDLETARKTMELLKNSENKRGLEYLANLASQKLPVKLNGIQESSATETDPQLQSPLQVQKRLSANGLENSRNPNNPIKRRLSCSNNQEVCNEFPRQRLNPRNCYSMQTGNKTLPQNQSENQQPRDFSNSMTYNDTMAVRAVPFRLDENQVQYYQQMRQGQNPKNFGRNQGNGDNGLTQLVNMQNNRNSNQAGGDTSELLANPQNCYSMQTGNKKLPQNQSENQQPQDFSNSMTYNDTMAVRAMPFRLDENQVQYYQQMRQGQNPKNFGRNQGNGDNGLTHLVNMQNNKNSNQTGGDTSELLANPAGNQASFQANSAVPRNVTFGLPEIHETRTFGGIKYLARKQNSTPITRIISPEAWTANRYLQPPIMI